MIAETVHESSVFPVHQGSSHRLDPVRARVTSGLPMTATQMLQANPRYRPEAEGLGPHALVDTRGTGPHSPHPGDIVYWVACLGGACLLLLAATM